MAACQQSLFQKTAPFVSLTNNCQARFFSDKLLNLYNMSAGILKHRRELDLKNREMSRMVVPDEFLKKTDVPKFMGGIGNFYNNFF